MRRLIGLLLAAFLALPATTGIAAPAPDAPGAGTVQAAITMFLRSDGRGLPVMYFGGAFAFDVVDVSGFAGRTRCRLKTRHGETVMICMGIATGQQLAPTDFSLDPLLREAHVEFDQGKFHHVMNWSNDGAFEPEYEANAGGTGVRASAEARSTGKLFDYRYTRRDQPLGFVMEGASANFAVDGVRLRVSPAGLVSVRVRLAQD